MSNRWTGGADFDVEPFLGSTAWVPLSPSEPLSGCAPVSRISISSASNGVNGDEVAGNRTLGATICCTLGLKERLFRAGKYARDTGVGVGASTGVAACAIFRCLDSEGRLSMFAGAD